MFVYVFPLCFLCCLCSVSFCFTFKGSNLNVNLGAMNLNLNLPGMPGTPAGSNLHLSDLPSVSINSLERKSCPLAVEAYAAMLRSALTKTTT